MSELLRKDKYSKIFKNDFFYAKSIGDDGFLAYNVYDNENCNNLLMKCCEVKENIGKELLKSTVIKEFFTNYHILSPDNEKIMSITKDNIMLDENNKVIGKIKWEGLKKGAIIDNNENIVSSIKNDRKGSVFIINNVEIAWLKNINGKIIILPVLKKEYIIELSNAINNEDFLARRLIIGTALKIRMNVHQYMARGGSLGW